MLPRALAVDFSELVQQLRRGRKVSKRQAAAVLAEHCPDTRQTIMAAGAGPALVRLLSGGVSKGVWETAAGVLCNLAVSNSVVTADITSADDVPYVPASHRMQVQLCGCQYASNGH